MNGTTTLCAHPGGFNPAPTMTSRQIAELVESRHDKVKLSIERLAERRVIALPPLGEYLDSLGRPALHYLVCKRDSFIVVAQLSPEFTARLVDRWQELETKAAKPTFVLPDFTNPAAAARAWADAIEVTQALAIERDRAIATKAQISNRREATAMATASAAVKENSKLKDQLGFSARHATILQVEDKMKGDFNFLPLRNWCKAMEVTPETVPDKRYPKGVKAWPAAAWKAAYGIDLHDLFGASE